eukprot:gnl/TRDRNA2_/TRDRNA2_81261_c0_seq1.p1 gnl/TRDRNA2_/TRDRNA2_81261_c0~~gnl/TRDRNA2_/TRDRNA2_81261_c0_seq1.p1  ORF type:complete len:529 (-),score=85.37 gnl/TRDRNA2_/TRDRNA2_81261_c0_seq1:44-1630(-)
MQVGTEVGSPRAPPRVLKRHRTEILWTESVGSPPRDVDMPPSSDKTPSPVPRLPLPCRSSLKQQASKEDALGSMDPPPRPPPWKRSNAASSAICMTPRRSPPRKGPENYCKPNRSCLLPPRSPTRLLTPRVSWSEIISQSQESLEDECGSPRTPLLRTRQPPSPPERLPWRRRPALDMDDDDARDVNEGRFEREFCDVTVIGKGQFSTVFRAKNQIDQCVYAVKKTQQIARGQRQTQLREVFALASVSIEAMACPNMVRYFSSWLEDGRLHIQTELCECSLRDRLIQRRREEPSDPRFGQKDVVQVLSQVSSGLQVLHSHSFVHMDIKPDNILISRGSAGCYKIADLGLAAAAMGCGCDDICEGDCRYLAKEVLRGDLSNLPKADVFSLGLVCYEIAINPKPLPANGDGWQQIRAGQLDTEVLAPLGESLVALLHQMVASTSTDRPSCEDILRHPSVAPDDGLQALHEEVRQRTFEAERNRKLADEYWQEMMSMKRQELLMGGHAGGTSSASPPKAPPQPVLVRGKTC